MMKDDFLAPQKRVKVIEFFLSGKQQKMFSNHSMGNAWSKLLKLHEFYLYKGN